MKRLLLLASKANYQTEAFVTAAARQNVRLDLATNRCHNLDDPWRDGALAVDFDNPDLARQDWDGITAVGDHASTIAATLAGRFGLRYHGVDSVITCRSKFELRQRFSEAGLLTPAYVRVPASEVVPCPLQFPCVLKPLGNTLAARGVHTHVERAV